MATATERRQPAQSIGKYWGMVKDIDDSMKLELIAMLAESIKPAAAKAQEAEEEEGDEEYSLKPYTWEEIHAMLDRAEANFAAGKGIPDEEAWDEWEEELAAAEQEELELAKAV